MRPFVRGMLAAALVTLVLAPAASARGTDRLVPYAEPSDLSLVWPARGTVTDGFGPRWGRQHSGLDIGILSTLDVAAAAGGIVTATGYLRGYEGYGQSVIVDLGGGLTTLYAHLSRIDVRVGARLWPGEPLGLAGCTGSCTGTHLHFELHRGGRAVDPSPFLH